MKKLIVILILIQASLVNAQKNIYLSDQFETLSKDHKTLAILPFFATLHLKNGEKLTTEQRTKLADKEGYTVQNAIETYFLKQKSKKKFSVNFQDTKETNALLKQHNISIDNLDIYTTQQLSEILGVDGIISGNLTLTALISDGVSTDFDLISFITGNSDYGRIAIKITDGKQSKLLWKYEMEITRKTGKNTYEIIEEMMKKAARKFPYQKIKKKQ